VPGDLAAFDLPVEGASRAELNGCYLRDGPNPREAIGHPRFCCRRLSSSG
jgi:carotenoid cleavage dioxygenase-like enzyme